MEKQFLFRAQYGTPELWSAIGSYCTRRTLKSLALVNRIMVDPAQRHLFKNLAFKCTFCLPDLNASATNRLPAVEESNAYLSRSLDRFRALPSSHLAGYVRRWICEGMVGRRHRLFEPAAAVCAEAIPPLVTSLHHYHLLQCLVLSRVVLDASTLLTISSFKKLNSLHLQRVILGCQLVLAVPLRLREFHIEILDDDNDTTSGHSILDSFFSPVPLESLALTYGAQRKASTVVSNLCINLLTQKPHSNLVRLIFTMQSVAGIELVVDLLEASPLLNTLKLVIEANSDDDLDNLVGALEEIELDINVCPLVNNLACPPTFATRFNCSSKPITELYLQNSDYYYQSPSLSMVKRAFQGINGEILVELELEATKTESARSLLPLMQRLFPNLQLLCMLINDLHNDADMDLEDGFLRDRFFDAKTIEDPDDLEQERNQFEACYDNGEDGAQLHFDEGYLRLVHDVAVGLIPVPSRMVRLDIPQNRRYKRLQFTKNHELELVKLFASGPASKQLQCLKLGMNNAYNRRWKKDSCDERWLKGRYYLRKEGRDMVGTMCFSLVPASPRGGHYKLERGVAI